MPRGEINPTTVYARDVHQYIIEQSENVGRPTFPDLMLRFIDYYE